jgi:hypothetical protein
MSPNPENVERLMRLALIDKGGRIAGAQMVMMVTMRRGSERVGGPRQVTPETLENILRRSVSGKVGSIGAYSSWDDMNAALPRNPEEGYLILDIDLGDNYDEVYKVTLQGPHPLYNHDGIIRYFKEIVCEMGVNYGCMLTGFDFVRVFSVLTLVPQCMLDEALYLHRTGQTDHPLIRFQDEIGFYASHRCMRHLREWIARAAWGNILSPDHVAKLGGEDRIRQESGCYLVERWGENLYLQLTESLWDVSKEDLATLNRYFEPIRFPGSPEPVYPEPLDLP